MLFNMKRLNICLTVDLTHDRKVDLLTEKCSLSHKLANIMKETQTVISEISSDGLSESSDDSSNCRSLLIKGTLANAERARQKIRNNIPVEFILSCRAKKVDVLGQQLLTAHFSTLFGVKINFLLIGEDESYQVSFRGNRKSARWLKEAALHFCDIIHIPPQSSVEAQFNVSSDHATLISHHAPMIERCTGVMLRCTSGDSLVLARGPVDSILRVGEFIDGLAPIQLHFTVSESDELFDAERIIAIARGMDVQYSVSEQDNNIQALLCTYEWNSRFLYELWRLASNRSSRVIPIHPNSWVSLGAKNRFFGNLVKTVSWTCCKINVFQETSNLCSSSLTIIRSPEKSPPRLRRLPQTTPISEEYESTDDSELPELQTVDYAARSPSYCSSPPQIREYEPTDDSELPELQVVDYAACSSSYSSSPPQIIDDPPVLAKISTIVSSVEESPYSLTPPAELDIIEPNQVPMLQSAQHLNSSEESIYCQRNVESS